MYPNEGKNGRFLGLLIGPLWVLEDNEFSLFQIIAQTQNYKRTVFAKSLSFGETGPQKATPKYFKMFFDAKFDVV